MHLNIMAKALLVMALIILSLIFASGCSKNPEISDAFNPSNLEYVGNLEPPTEPPFNPTPEDINQTIGDFFSG